MKPEFRLNIIIKYFLYTLLMVVIFSSCIDSMNTKGDIIIINKKTYEMETRFAEGYWFIPVDTTKINMKGRRIFINNQ